MNCPVAVEQPDAAGLRHRDHHVALLPARNVGIDPLHRRGVGIDGSANEGSLVDMVEVPIVAR